MQFSEILLDIYDRTGAGQSPVTDVSRRIKRYVNAWNRKILTMNGMQSMRRVVIPKASVADQPLYGIAASKIAYMSETATQRRIYEKTLGWYRETFPDPAQFSGTPLNYVPAGYSRIHTRPSAASELFVKSTEALDTGTVRVEAIRSNGYTKSLSVALTGTTAVTLGAAYNDVIDVTDFRLATAQTGVVTLHQTSGAGTELSRIQIGRTYQRFLTFALAPTPSQVITYNVDAIAEIVDMSNDTDEPFPSPDFHDVLVMGGCYEEWMNRGRFSEARTLMHGGNPNRPTEDSILGRINALRLWVLEWDYGDDAEERGRSFEETIHLPVE